MSNLSQLIDNLVVGREDVVCELNLDHGPQPIDPHAECGSENPSLGKRCVEDTVCTMLGLQSISGPEDSTKVADIFTVDDDVVISVEHYVEGIV